MVAPIVIVGSTTPTSILLSWSRAGSEVDIYVVTWERATSRECSYVDIGNTTIADSSTNYTITKLVEDSTYIITVKAINATGSTVTGHVTGMTGEAGEELNTRY